MSRVDELYVSADTGIDMLPDGVQCCIRTARIMYSKIHDKIREAEYDVFSERVGVSVAEKLKIASTIVPKTTMLWMLATNCGTWCLLNIYYTAVPSGLLLYARTIAVYIDGDGFSYEGFLAVYLLVPIGTLCGYCAIRCALLARRAAAYMSLLCIVATVWTTPWDNYLVYSGVWGYNPQRILHGRIGYVPLAEYAFFSLQTVLCSLIWLVVFSQRTGLRMEHPPSCTRSKWHHAAIASMALFGLFCTYEPRGTYLGLMMMWASPPLMLQWWFGAELLLCHFKPLCLSTLCSTLYLCIADCWTIHSGIWNISRRHSLPVAIYGLPLEEAIFLALASMMCNFGLTLAMIASRLGFTPRDVVKQWGYIPKHVVEGEVAEEPPLQSD